MNSANSTKQYNYASIEPDIALGFAKEGTLVVRNNHAVATFPWRV